MASFSNVEQTFQLLPLVFELISAVQKGDSKLGQEKVRLFQARIAECRAILESLPGGDLTASQQQELIEYYQQRLRRKRFEMFENDMSF